MNPTSPLGEGGLAAPQSKNPSIPSSLLPKGRGLPLPLPCLGNPSGPLFVMWGFLWLPPSRPGARQTTPRVAARRPRGCQGSPKGAKRHQKTTPRRANRSPKGAQTAAWDSLGHPLGRPGAAWCDHHENELGQSFFLAQKWTWFWIPWDPNFDNFRCQFSY